MCGISGEYRTDGQAANVDLVRRMNDRLAPRGPDSEGVFAQRQVALGHRRLKIMDMSEQSAQPMVDPELGLAMVFNGAIYNYRELRRELELAGYRFFSDGDTEVLLKAWHAWGIDALRRLQGMFAFAVWDRDSGRLVMARDRLGIKPLYYSRDNRGLRFASTLPALLEFEGIDRDIDPVALNHYMSFHAVVPAPRTMLRGVRKLPPASYMVIEPDGAVRSETWWDLSYRRSAEDAERGEQEWKEMLSDALRTAVRRRQVAAVDVGVLLSGGVDSSLLVGLMAEAGQSLQTFSVGFEAVNEEAGDEFQYSDLVAEHFGTRHHKLFIPPGEVLETLPDAIGAMAEPMVSHDCVAFHLLSREVSQHCRVVQSGQGADEVFGGYHWYPPMYGSPNAVERYSQVFFDRDFDEYARAVDPRFVDQDHATAFVTAHFDHAGAGDPVDKALHLDTTVMLVDDPVKRVDNMTMAWGLEARVPFLDHELVELAARIPPELKTRDQGKYILKETARDFIPHAVIDRPKGYFPVPALKYLQGPFLDYVRDAVTSESARGRRLWNPEYVSGLLDDPEAHITPLRGSKLWQVALLELWLQSHDV